MDNAIQVSFTPIQVLLSVAFQLWILIFPILILRKLHYLTQIVTEHITASQGQLDKE